MVEKLVEKHHKPVKNVRLYASYFDPRTMTAVIEYIVEFDTGTLSAKIVHANNPSKALIEYYRKLSSQQP